MSALFMLTGFLNTAVVRGVAPWQIQSLRLLGRLLIYSEKKMPTTGSDTNITEGAEIGESDMAYRHA
jgi:hypothetical protein